MQYGEALGEWYNANLHKVEHYTTILLLVVLQEEADLLPPSIQLQPTRTLKEGGRGAGANFSILSTGTKGDKMRQSPANISTGD
jgi:hypothetical protein